ncbi:hypothetical protein, partial [Achromobacter insuavis]|uniref:hypothetical protein n=1 Tax=Achromobacter insuavis TaxID=1287735 RepID=UPI0035A0D481
MIGGFNLTPRPQPGAVRYRASKQAGHAPLPARAPRVEIQEWRRNDARNTPARMNSEPKVR